MGYINLGNIYFCAQTRELPEYFLNRTAIIKGEKIHKLEQYGWRANCTRDADAHKCYREPPHSCHKRLYDNLNTHATLGAKR